MRQISELFDNLQLIDELKPEHQIENLFEKIEKEEAERILSKAMEKIDMGATASATEIREIRKKPRKLFSKKKLAFSILVAALIGTITVSAQEGSGVEQIVEVIEKIVIKKPLAEKVHMESIEPETVEETESVVVENIEEEEKTKVEHGGVIVAVEQVVSDGEDAYVYLSVKLPQELRWDLMDEEGTLYFRQNSIQINGNEPQRAGCIIQRESEYQGYVIVHVELMDVEATSYEVVLTLNNLDYAVTKEDGSSRDIERVVEGSWVLEWNMQCEKKTERRKLEAQIDAYDGIVTTEYAIVSPLSLRIVGTVECDDPQYNQTSCYIANVILKDGTIEDYSASWSQIEDGRFIMKCYYNRMIPMDDIVGVVVNNEYLYF